MLSKLGQQDENVSVTNPEHTQEAQVKKLDGGRRLSASRGSKDLKIRKISNMSANNPSATKPAGSSQHNSINNSMASKDHNNFKMNCQPNSRNGGANYMNSMGVVVVKNS